MIISKKGLSPVITMIAVLLGIVLVAIHSPRFSPAFDCASWKATAPLTIQGVCYNTTNKDLRVQMYRPGNDILSSFTLTARNAASTASWSCGDECESCSLLKERTTKTYYFVVDAPPRTVQLAIGSCMLEEKSVPLC
jgi:hypothetical protein